jgi:hypothetical protein
VPAGTAFHGEAQNEEFSWSFTTKIHIGIEETATGEDKILIHPNPSRGIFNVCFTNPSAVQSLSGSQWEVLNTHGTILKTGHCQTNNLTIDLSTQSEGMYFLTITKDEQRIVKKLMVK